MSQHVIRMHGVKKDYVMGTQTVHALRGVNLSITTGEFVSIMGASGSGKSTMMNILGCLDVLTQGEYFLDDVDVTQMGADQLADIRNDKIGFVFQGFNLLSRTSAIENVELPLLYDRKHRVENITDRALECLRLVGLEDRKHHEPNQMSGGQQQRVAIARALVNNPPLLLADEPTGNLDTRTSFEIMRLFQELNEKGLTIILVTHENDIAQFSKRRVVLRDGHIIKDEPIINRLNAEEMLANLTELPDETDDNS